MILVVLSALSILIPLLLHQVSDPPPYRHHHEHLRPPLCALRILPPELLPTLHGSDAPFFL